MTTPETPKPKQKKGFACISPERRKEIASMGGKAAQAKGVAHEFKGEKAREAGRKGGTKTASKPGHMAKIGAKGGATPKRK